MLNYSAKMAKAPMGLSLILVLFCTACGFQADKIEKIDQYFNLEAFINNQIKMISNSSVYIQKEMELDNQQESVKIQADSATLVKEFQFWFEADINKSANRNAFTESSKTVEGVQIIKYLPKNESSQVVKLMEVHKSGDLIRKIEIHYSEENSIYLSERKLKMDLNEQGMLTQYSIVGYQKMILKTPVQYTIKGQLMPN